MFLLEKSFWKIIWCILGGGHSYKVVKYKSPFIYVKCDYCGAAYELQTSESFRLMLEI